MRTYLIAALVLLRARAARRPITANWHLTNQGTADLLVPAGARPDLSKRTLAVGHPAAHSCPARIAVTRDMFLNQPDGWLTTWVSDLEAHGCIPRGEESVLAARIDESLPLDPAAAYKSLYPKDLIPPVRFEVTSPVVRDPSDTLDLVEVVAGTELNPRLESLRQSHRFRKGFICDSAQARRPRLRRPEDILPTLAISRLYHDGPTPLEFDHSNSSILRLPLMGGEIITWTR